MTQGKPLKFQYLQAISIDIKRLQLYFLHTSSIINKTKLYRTIISNNFFAFRFLLLKQVFT